jgi:type I restriction enzyme S subunit
MEIETLVGDLPPKWTYSTLGEICTQSGGSVQTGPFGSQLHASDYVVEGIPSIMPQNIGENRINRDGIARIRIEDAKRLGKYRVRKGDIVYSRRGDVERRALIREEENGWLCGTGCLRIRFGDERIEPFFASQYLGDLRVREWIVRHAHGATMPNLNTSILSELPFVLPPLPTQKAIAHILSTLDDKIELLRNMNETLEAMARALFKSWFIDFDPVRKKAEGQPTGLLPEIDSLFPDSFEDSEIGEMPKGWEVKTLGEAVEIAGGSTPSTTESGFWNGTYCFATPKDLSQAVSPILIATERRITDQGVGQITSGQLPRGTLLLSSRAPIGYLALTDVPVSINQGFIAIKAESKLSPLYMYAWCKENMDSIIGHANGTTFLEISKSNFRTIKTFVPGKSLLNQFDKIASSLVSQIRQNTYELNTLIETRDSLLPKLISGDLELSDEAISKILEPVK